MNIVEYVRSRPVVTIASVKKVLDCGSSYASLVLHRLVKRGVLRKVSRNRYTASDDTVEIATNLYTPSYLSFWSASQYYGYTEQILSTVQVVTTSPHKDIFFEGFTFKFVVLPKKYFFGYLRVQTRNGSLFVVEKEKLLLDVLLRERELGNSDEVAAVFKRADVQKDRVVDFLRRAKTVSLTKRVGFLLERERGMDISCDIDCKDTNYVPLSVFLPRAKKSVSKWRVLV